jgi:hypothetical protein
MRRAQTTDIEVQHLHVTEINMDGTEVDHLNSTMTARRGASMTKALKVMVRRVTT